MTRSSLVTEKSSPETLPETGTGTAGLSFKFLNYTGSPFLSVSSNRPWWSLCTVLISVWCGKNFWISRKKNNTGLTKILYHKNLNLGVVTYVRCVQKCVYFYLALTHTTISCIALALSLHKKQTINTCIDGIVGGFNFSSNSTHFCQFISGSGGYFLNVNCFIVLLQNLLKTSSRQGCFLEKMVRKLSNRSW